VGSLITPRPGSTGNHVSRKAPLQLRSRPVAQDDHQTRLVALEHRIDQAAAQERDGVGVGHPRVRPHVKRRLARVGGLPQGAVDSASHLMAAEGSCVTCGLNSSWWRIW
jgi:hypothetical protein